MSDETVKQRALELATEINAIHQKGAGTIDLVRLLDKSGLPPPPAGDPRLLGRTGVEFTATGPAGGVFRSVGTAVEFPTEIAHIVVPAELKGTYESAPDGFALSFDPGSALFGHRTTAAARLQAIRVDPQGVDFELGGLLGPLFSRRFRFADWGAVDQPVHIVNIIRAAYFQHMSTDRG